MATVRTESEQPLDDELVNGIFPGDKAEQQHASDTSVDRNAEVCAQGSSVKETNVTDADVPSSPANENSPPHGAAAPSPRNKDASEMSCNSTATVGEPKMNEDFQSNNGILVSNEPAEDCGVTADNMHNGNRGQETNKDMEENTSENSSLKKTIKEVENASEETESHAEAAQGEREEMGDPDSMAQDKHKTEGEDESKNAGTIKIRKSRLVCKECGKKFTRRETYNLHRHFHMHQDEEASLACKECGVTFQHRSDLIKHRSTHKEDTKPKFVSKVRKRRRSSDKTCKRKRKFQCEHCGMCFLTMVRLNLHVCKHNVEKPFRCPLCRKEFQYRMSINAHMQSHSLDSPYRCLECNKGFQSVESMHIHQRSHAALKPYECPDCNMVFKHRSVMEDHRRRHMEEKPHQCKICHKNFKYSSLLQQHKYLHTGRKPYHCSYCRKRFAFAQNMRAHCRQHKKISDSADSESRITNHKVSYGGDGGKENTNLNVEQQRNCPLCPQMFYKAGDLRSHMLIHEAEYERMSNGKHFDMMYACRFCPLRFPTEYTLQSHVETHQTNVLGVNTSHIANHANAVPEKRDAVNIDNTESPSEGGLGDQTEKKPFRCKDCGKCFRYRSVLELHMRVHNKGYQCPVCKKTFRFSSYLQQHSIIHTGKKPYKCPDCGKDFAFHHNMKTHQRLHQQKPYRCTQCRKGYSDESQLQRHMLSHTGEKPYKCHLCVKSFSLAYLLRDHLNTHTGERPHRCQECHKSFPWLSSLLVHQKIHTRKWQGQGHGYPLSIYSSRGRVREFVSSGRRGRPRLARDNGRSLRQDALSGQIMQQRLLPDAVPQQLHDFDADRREHVQVGSQAQIQQEWPLQIPLPEDLLHSQKSLLEIQPTDVEMQWQGSPIKMSGNDPSFWVNAPNSSQQKNSLDSQCHMERPSSLDVKTKSPRSSQSPSNQRVDIQDPQQSQWSASSDSVQTSKPKQFNDKRTIDLDKPTSNESELTQMRKEDLQNQKSPGLTKSEMGQTGVVMLSTGASNLQNMNLWGPKASFEMSTTASVQEILGDALENQTRLIQHLQQQPSQQVQQLLNQQLHQPQLQQQTQITWVGAGPSSQIGPLNMPYTSARFPRGDRPPMWGFQTTPVISQALLNGPAQQGHIRPPQHVALISGQQIPLNQPSSFISSPFPPPALNISAPLPMHSVGSQLSGPLPQGIFFTSQGTINEMPLIPQVTNLPQLAQQTESHKIGNKMPFPPDHLIQCMICGCSLPGELELQMHYMQHAQRDV